MNLKFFHCKYCGNFVIDTDGGDAPICCGEPMEELTANTVEASREKHLPDLKIDGDRIHVAVGSVAHPMTAAHFIQVIYLETEKGGIRKNLKAGDAPEADFTVPDGDKAVAVYAFCNLHGLWKTAI